MEQTWNVESPWVFSNLQVNGINVLNCQSYFHCVHVQVHIGDKLIVAILAIWYQVIKEPITQDFKTVFPILSQQHLTLLSSIHIFGHNDWLPPMKGHIFSPILCYSVSNTQYTIIVAAWKLNWQSYNVQYIIGLAFICQKIIPSLKSPRVLLWCKPFCVPTDGGPLRRAGTRHRRAQQGLVGRQTGMPGRVMVSLTKRRRPSSQGLAKSRRLKLSLRCTGLPLPWVGRLEN